MLAVVQVFGSGNVVVDATHSPGTSPAFAMSPVLVV